ncbi:molecular chaperone TorD family protein [Shewanella sp. D64]|uniref:TorD/DmsD family molecular chaperone n=1 Tax=unclassified Shewanella TaxID=196818 RepID=UPI0022BA24F6|nr:MULTISPECIES: molecular chaperone TorD family protein [unclassified Shewanella]MEC4727150.1 molecular chaperone TorD family protein [Shewanella sp. D64]MEC4739233.1 molecular chaperone TorD family protein [Shewanella sp. E94]WBJ95573.1 molecular chaperone TorD family protein [Shewanella sp. MTB7]
MSANPMTAAGLFVYKSLFFGISKEKLLNLSEYLVMTEPDSELIGICQQMAESAEAVEIEYNQLCVGPYRLAAPPYESVYRGESREIFTKITEQVEAHYQSLGLMADRASGEPADFIGNELEYLFVLHCKYLQENSDKADITNKINGFIAIHLSQWYEAFLNDIYSNTSMPFWKLFSEHLGLFIKAQMPVKD